MSHNILIIGATSSLGNSICRILAKRKNTLVLSARDVTELEKLAQDIKIRYGVKVTTIPADFSSNDFDAKDFVKKSGSFSDVYMITGNMGNGDSNDSENIRNIINVNYTIPAQLLTIITSKMEKEGRGRIAVISSVAGDRGRQSNYPYGSAKAGLTAFASGLRNRFAKTGIHIMTVKPGFIDTPMTYGMNSPLIASRECVAKKIITSLDKSANEIYVPFFWRYIMLIIKNIPEFIFKKLKL